MISTRPAAASRWLPGLALALVLAAFIPALSDPGVIRAPLPKLSDATAATHPWHVFWRDEVREGRAPLWNPYVFAGMPAYGEPQMQTFYPVNALWLVAPAGLAFKVALVLHVLLGGWFTYRLTRELGATRAGASLGALVFGLHGQMVVFVFAGWTQVVAPMAWAPFVLWQLARALSRPARGGWRAAALAGLGLGLQLLSGHPEWVRYTLLAGGIMTLAGRGAVPFGARVKRGAAALLIGFLVGMPQLGPTLQAAARSSRGQAAMASGPALAGASLPPETLPTLVVPKLFGPWDLSVSTDGLAHKARQAPISFGESLVYVGILPLLLAVAGARAGTARGNRSAATFMVIGGVGMVFALNDLTHAQDLLDVVLPPDAVFRSPARFTFLVNLALIVLTALGWSHLERGAFRAAHRLTNAAWALAALLGAGAVAASWGTGALAGFIAARAPVPPALSARPELADGGGAFLRWAVSSAASETAVAAVLAAAAALALRRFGTSLPSRLSLVVVLLLVAVDLGLFARPFLTSVVSLDAVYRDDLAVLRPVASDRSARAVIDTNVLTAGPNSVIPARARSVGGYDLFVLEEWTRLDRAVQAGGDRVLGLAGVTHRIARNGRGAPVLSRITASRGRAWWADRVVIATDADAAATWLLRADEERTIALEPASGAAAVSGAPDGAAALEIVTDEPGRFTARVSSEHPGWLVLTEAYYPGWRAWVGGAPVKVVRAFGIFQAVPVPAGTHLIEIAHRPRLWPFFTAALVGLGVVSALGRSRAPRGTRGPAPARAPSLE